MKIGSHIRLFESLVILGLKKYVNSTETDFQSAVLDLLVQLLLLRVNYGLLDADDVRGLLLVHIDRLILWFFFRSIFSIMSSINWKRSKRVTSV